VPIRTAVHIRKQWVTNCVTTEPLMCARQQTLMDPHCARRIQRRACVVVDVSVSHILLRLS
jgi:hypothetical protein